MQDKIEKVVKIKEGVYQINDCVYISNLDFQQNGKFYADIRYDESLITEESAEKLVNKFIVEAIQDNIQ